MLCVNLNSPEFKQQAKRNGVSESKLEQIIHKYRIQTGQEDGNPSDGYIQQELGNVMYEEPSDNVIRLWRQEYNHPMEYKTKEELDEAHEKAAQFFPESSIIHYVDNESNYVLNIKEPVKDLSANNQSYRYTQEMMQIKRQAIIDGNFMLAPNGKQTNLTERQWLQVRTKAFKNWFGDWQNDLENTSKVVDENGEPLVVYRASRWSGLKNPPAFAGNGDYTVFDKSRNSSGFFFTNRKSSEERYTGNNLRAFFLNSRNPDISNNFNILQADREYSVDMGYDGVLFAPDKEGVRGDNFEVKVFESNQIKSATNNIGTYSDKDNDINYHINYWQRRRRYENMLKNRLSGIGSLSLARKLVREFNKAHNTNFGLAPDMKITNLPKPTGADTITQDNSFASREQMNGVAAFLRQLLPGVKLYVYNQADFERIKQDYGFNPDAEAFIYKGIIVTSDRLREADILIEEFLHPFVETLIIKQPELYHRLLEEAKVAFPTLYSQIHESYNDYSRTVQDKEIITQALSRYFREDLGKSKMHHNKFEEIAKKFIDFIKGIFGLNMDFTKNVYGNQVVPIDRLINIQSLSDMAMVLNTSGISFDVSEGIGSMGEKRTYHLENQSNKSDESTFKYIDDAISTGNWNEEAITAVNDLIKDIEDGKKQYNRFVLRDQQHAFQRGGRIYETASVILGREIERKRQESPDKGREREESPVERRKRWEEEGRYQESIIESWAKANDLWLNDYEDPNGNRANSLEDLMQSQWDYFDRGSEAIAYTFDDNTVIKAINLSHYDNNLLRALDKIALHNTLSPNTALEVVGFGRDALGHFQIIALQPYIQGEELTDAEFEEFKSKLGAKESEGWYYIDNYKITDLAPYNIKKYRNELTGKDEYGIIDADFQLQADDHQIDNSIHDISSEEPYEHVDSAIQTGIWTDEALQQLDNLIEEYNNGRNEITQILGRGLSERSRGTEAYAAASIISRRVQSTMRKSNDALSTAEEFRARNRERRLKETAIQLWAQENGWWWNDFAEGRFLDDYLIDEYGEVSAEGSESIIHISKDGKYVIKAMSAIASDGDLVPLFQKIELHNQIFTNTPLEILGFGRTKDGSFRVMLQQPLVIGEKISSEEAEQTLVDLLGVTNDHNNNSQTLFDGRIIVRDITNPQNRGNILKGSEGNYFVIDADIAFSKEALDQISGLSEESIGTSIEQNNIPVPEASIDNAPINIWSTEKNGYESLSNLAQRPFTLDNVLVARLFGSIPNPVMRDVLNRYIREKGESVTVNAVENLFQAMKLFYSDRYVQNGRFTEEGKRIFEKIISEHPSTAKRDGGRNGIVKDLDQMSWDSESKAIMEVIARYSFDANPGSKGLLLSTGTRQLTHTQGDRIWKKAFPAVLMKIRSDYQKSQATDAGSAPAATLSATIAPYSKTEVTANNFNDVKNNVEQQFRQKAKDIAKALGLELFDRDISTNIESMENMEGNTVEQVASQLSYTFNFRDNADIDKIRVFTALMADLGFEQQESATMMQYVAENDVNFNAVEYAVKVNSLPGVLPMLEKYGFTDFTVNNTKKEVTVLVGESDRSAEESAQMFEQFIQELINNNNYAERRTSRVQVEKLGREARRKAYTDYSGQRAVQQLQDGQSQSGQSQALTAMIDDAMSTLFDKPVEEQAFVLDNYVQLTQQETPEVDADWKKPLLKKLDAELDTEKSNEANAPIFDIISKVLNAETETEAREIMSEQQRKQERELDNYDKLTSQIDNIYNSGKLGVSEVRHIAELAMNAISDEITRLQTDPEEKDRMFPELKTDLDFTKATRKQIIDAIGINTLLEYAKKLFNPNRYDDIDTMWQAWDIMDNWDGIIQFGSDVFVLNEGFGINKDFDKDRYETNGRQAVELGSEMYGDDVTMPYDIDGIAENGSKQEHWQIEFRTIDTVNDLINNILVKRALHDCYLKDEGGNVIISKWGIPERVPVRDAVQSILHWVQGTNGLAEMIANLESHVAGNRWLESLIEKLKDPAESTMQSQFTGVFWKPFQLMGVVTYDKKKGKYISKPVNRHPALSETMNRIKVDFQAAMHPLFIGYGKDVRVNMDYLGTEESTHDLFDKTKPITLRRALAYLNEIKRTYNAQQGNKVFTKEMAEESAPYLTAVCRMLGFYADESLVRSAVMMTENDSRTNEKKYNPQAFNTMTTKLGFIVEALDKAVAKERAEHENPTPDYAGYDPFKFRGENSILGSLTDFLTPVTNQLEDTYNSSVYDSGKMYQSYVIPSPMTLLMNKLKSNKVKANNIEQEFITDFYGKSEWFAVPGAGGRMVWRNEMLKELATNPKAREIFEHRVELNFNKHNFMRTMSPQEQTLAMITEYYAERNETGDRNRAVSWYKIPMESNKPSAEYIKFWSYRGEPDVYKANITRDLFRMFLQEFSRIQTVRMRNKDKSDPGFIENWDVNGRKFCFLPFFNQYLEGKGTLLQNIDGYTAEDDALLAKEIKERLSGENIDFSLADEFHGDSNGKDTRFVNMVKDAIKYFMEQMTNTILDAWEKEGILKEAKKIEHVNDPRKDVENFIWNHYLMAKNILQLTIGDIAFYKDAEDLQKRLAQLHSPGIRGNKYATWNGEQVSDGFYRTVIAKDLRKQMNFHSNLIANLTEVLDKKYEDAPDYEKEGWLMLKDSLVGENGLYRDVNVTDAQAYSSPTSYRKKAVIFGKWSDEAEAVYNKLLDGTATLSDVRMAFQPLKPFVYGLLEKSLGVDEAPITTMLEPFQAKNSEYLLIMADALLQNEETSQPNLLRAIYQVMEDSYFVGRERDANGKIVKQGTYTGKGIDTIQFESAIKSSLQGAIDIGEHWNNIDGEAEVVRMLEDRIYKKDANGRIMRDEYDEMTYVHKLDYDNYCIQQEVPEHFRDHDQTHGSQIRMITHSDLDYYYDPNGDLSDPANVVMYEVREYDRESGKFITKKLTADQFKREYEETISENLDHSYEKLVQELQIEGSKKERNLALSKILRREILNSPRYGIDLLLACTVDKEGNFRIPKGDPIQAKRIEQLCNSIIKNRLNKQEIAGGPIVQVTNFGTRRLSVIFKDKFTGGLLLTEDQWNQKIASGEELPVSMTGKAYGGYSEYIDGRQGGIAHFECFAPAWSREIFDKFTRSDGSIDVEAIDRLDPDLLKMVGYRIPTEDKYSCAPLKIKGFLPAIAGEAIMMPYELTTINDSDFDVDKEYVMRKVIFINLKDNERIAEDMWKSVKHWDDVSSSLEVKEMIDEFVQNPDEYKDKDAFYERLWDEYIRNAYYTSHPKEGTLYRNNKIVDMTYEILSHETNVLKVLKPGGFDNLKKPAYLIEAYKLNVGNDEYKLDEHEVDKVKAQVEKEAKDKNWTEDEWNSTFRRRLQQAQHKKAWDELSKLPMDELKKRCDVDKDLAWVDTEIQFYRQNAAAASLIGVQAVNKVAHAVLEGDGFHIDVGSLCGDFVIGGNMDENGNYVGGKYFGGMMEVDKTYNDNGELIGKTLGSTVSASADASKYPIYNLVNVNMATVNIMNTLLRLGMPDAQVFRFMSQDVITRTIEEYNKANLSGNASLAGTVETMMGRIKEEHANNLPSDSQLFSEELSDDEMIEGILPGEHPEIDLKVLNIVQKLLAISGVMRNLDHPTRFNSVSSAVGPLIIDNLISEYKINKFTIGGAGEAGTRIYTRYKEEDLTDEDRRILDNPDTPDNHPLKLGFKQADFFTVLDKHPILAGFYRGLDIAKRLFRDMPAGSEGFRNLLNSLPENVQDSIFNDKKLLDKLCMFYQTYMLVAAGLLNPGKKSSTGKTEFESYIKGFPKWFMEIEKSEQFRKELDLDNNPFVKAIQYDVDSESGNFYLKMNLTGLDTQVKQSLIDGWVDLFKKGEKGKDLATKLMIYNIYRGGIGFSPKTFTALISTYLKENFSGQDRNGNEVRYKDIFDPEKWPSMNNERIFDQFVRNNWDDYRLVKDMSKAKKLGIDYTKGELTVRTDYSMDGSKDDFAVKEVRPYKYITTERYLNTKDSSGKPQSVKVTLLWRKEFDSDNVLTYKLIKPLGNNGEYLEMNINDIRNPLTDTYTVMPQEDSSTIREESQAEKEATSNDNVDALSEAQKERNLNTVKERLVDRFISNNRNSGRDMTIEDAEKRFEEIKEDLKNPGNHNKYRKFLHNLLSQIGVEVDMDKTIEKFLEFC